MYAKKTYRRKAGGVKKRVYKRKPKASVSQLARRVNALTKKLTTVTERDQYVYDFGGVDAAAPYVAVNLCNYSSWQKLWTSTTAGVQNIRSKMYHRYCLIDNTVSLDNINNEEGEIDFTYMVISRRDTAGTASDTGGGLSLSAGIDFTGSDGRVFINLKKWKLHYVRRFTLTGGDGADMQSDNCMKRISHRVKIGATVENPDGDWRSMTNSPDPSDTYYAVLFNNNLTADLENPRWKLIAYHSLDN